MAAAFLEPEAFVGTCRVDLTPFGQLRLDKTLDGQQRHLRLKRFAGETEFNGKVSALYYLAPTGIGLCTEGGRCLHRQGLGFAPTGDDACTHRGMVLHGAEWPGTDGRDACWPSSCFCQKFGLFECVNCRVAVDID